MSRRRAKVDRARVALGRITMEFTSAHLREQGPASAIATLKAAACERGAFIVENLRGLPTADGGMVYEATLATLVDDSGRPLNAAAPAAR